MLYEAFLTSVVLCRGNISSKTFPHAYHPHAVKDTAADLHNSVIIICHVRLVFR